jgi:CBS domain-containing protein
VDVDDIADFLGSHPPFDVMGTDEATRVAAVTEPESYPAGKTIFSQGAGPVAYLWVVRAGSVEIVHNGRVLDLLCPGEMFGHASMLSGLPTGFEARAGEDTLCYRIPADIVRPRRSTSSSRCASTTRSSSCAGATHRMISSTRRR